MSELRSVVTVRALVSFNSSLDRRFHREVFGDFGGSSGIVQTKAISHALKYIFQLRIAPLSCNVGVPIIALYPANPAACAFKVFVHSPNLTLIVAVALLLDFDHFTTC